MRLIKIFQTIVRKLKKNIEIYIYKKLLNIIKNMKTLNSKKNTNFRFFNKLISN